MSALPIPPALLQRIIAFLTAGATGKIEIDVKDGRIVNCRLTESVPMTGDIVKLREHVLQ